MSNAYKITGRHNALQLAIGLTKLTGRRLGLRYANLRYADLCGANLRYADLCGANLRYADLCGANLRYANLRYADLCGAWLPSNRPASELCCRLAKLGACTDAILWAAHLHPHCSLRTAWEAAPDDWRWFLGGDFDEAKRRLAEVEL